MPSYGQQMKYPYTLTAKVMQFPWKWHWQNARFVRYLAYGLVFSFPLIYKFHSMANNAENKRKWAEIRQAREHTHFDPVH
ncbi:hypothetical protein ScPMuIL_014800 [Solemya velum]